MERDEKGQWKPGESGNLKGRPVFSIVSKIKAKLQGVPEGEKEALLDIMIDEYIATVRKTGLADIDGVAMRDLMDRFDGKPKQHIHVDNHLDGAWGEYLSNVSRTEQEADEDTEAVLEDDAEDGDNGRRCTFGEDGPQ